MRRIKAVWPKDGGFWKWLRASPIPFLQGFGYQITWITKAGDFRNIKLNVSHAKLFTEDGWPVVPRDFLVYDWLQGNAVVGVNLHDAASKKLAAHYTKFVRSKAELEQLCHADPEQYTLWYVNSPLIESWYQTVVSYQVAMARLPEKSPYNPFI